MAFDPKTPRGGLVRISLTGKGDVTGPCPGEKTRACVPDGAGSVPETFSTFVRGGGILTAIDS